MKKCRILAAISIAMWLGIAGCSSYYRVTDPVSGKVYYTTDIDREGNGAISFQDEVTMREVTLQQSEVMEIKKNQFLAAGKGRESEQ